MLHSGICEGLFSQLAIFLLKTGEVTGKNIFIDGTKVESRANKYTFVWKKSVGKHEARMHGQLLEKVDEINREYLKGSGFQPETAKDDLYAAIEDLKMTMEQHGIQEVHGCGKRKSQIQRDKEYLESCLKRQEKYDIHKKNFKGRNSYSKTDPDATFIHMKDDHMRNAQLKPGYNIQIGVDSEYIMGVGVFADRSETNTLIPFMEKLEENLGYKYESITADAGYENEENYIWLEKERKIPYIKLLTYEKWKNEASKKRSEGVRT